MSSEQPLIVMEDSDNLLSSSGLPDQQDVILHSMETPYQGQANAIIVKMVPQSSIPTSTKLKSLLPKSLVNQASSSSVTTQPPTLSYQVVPVSSNEQPISLPGAEIVPPISDKNSCPSSVTQAHMILNSELVGPVGIEGILQQLNKTSASEVESQTIVVEFAGEKASEALSETQIINQPIAEASMSADNDSSLLQGTSCSIPAALLEKEADSNIVKKTMVEAYVKMVVCRKVTVETVDIKTCSVLDTKVKVEEEEPVILGVDCVETTEDFINSSTGEPCKPKSKSGSENTGTASKWGSSLDGGLKFLSAVSESRQRISKTLLRDKIQKHTGLPIRSNSESSASKLPTIVKSETIVEEKVDSNEDIDTEWQEDQDQSEDFVPSHAKLAKPTNFSNKNSNSKATQIKNEPKQNSEDQIVLLPKKRGRKRKWNNLLGLASNLRTCQFCKKHFKNVASCTKHMRKGTCVSSVFCFICSKAFPNEQELESHLSSHAQEPKLGEFKCQDCHRTYRTKSGYLKHFHQGTCQRRKDLDDGVTGEFQCDLCDSSFSSQEYLQLHRYKVHENPQDRHTCPDCGKKFYSWQGYQKHRSSQRSCTEPLKCHICGKRYSNKARESYKLHMKHHKSEASGITYNCEECGRGYMSQMALNKHKLSHTGVKPYRCDICNKEFSMRYMVKDHARMHTGDRPFLCGLCGSAFSNKGHLGRHLRSHENGTLLKRGRPKKSKEPTTETVTTRPAAAQETNGIKMIDIRETLQGFDSSSIQVVDGQMFDSHPNGTPMIIQADHNTIIIAEGWPDANGSAHPVNIHNAQEIVNVTSGIIPPTSS